MQREEGKVGEEGVAARRRDQDVAERLGVLRELSGQHRRRPVHHLLHVAAHAVQRQVVGCLQARPGSLPSSSVKVE